MNTNLSLDPRDLADFLAADVPLTTEQIDALAAHGVDGDVDGFLGSHGVAIQSPPHQKLIQIHDHIRHRGPGGEFDDISAS